MTVRGTDTKKGLSGKELRDRSWHLLNQANLDLSPKYIRGFDDSGGWYSRFQDDIINGLIRTPMGYYRLAEDARDGTRVLLHSYERGQLQGEWRDGAVRLPKGANDVYGIAAHQHVRGAIFRDDMNHDIRLMETYFQKDLNLHAEEFISEQPAEEGREPKRAYKFINGRCGFGIFPTDDGKWRVRFYRNLRVSDEASRFADIGNKAPGNFITRFFSLGSDLKEFDGYDEAFKYVRRNWIGMSLRAFKGRKDTLTDNPTLKERTIARAVNFFEQKRYRDWGVAIPVGLATGFVSTLFTGVPVLGAAFAVMAGAGWVFGGKMVENFIYHNMTRILEKSDKQELESLKPHFQQNSIERYLRNDKASQKRFRRKITEDASGHLRLLSHEESDINYDDGVFTDAKNPMRVIESLSTAPYRYFGAINDATHYDKGLLACAFPNGLVTLTHVDTKTRAARHYLTYREEFNELGVAKKHLEPELEKLPDAAAPVHKITHRQGRDFLYTGMTPEEFLADLMDKAGMEAKDCRVLGIRIADLFNVRADAVVEARAKPGRPIPKWFDSGPEPQALPPSVKSAEKPAATL